MIETESTLEAWKKLLRHIYENGNNYVDEDNRRCREILNFVVTIKNPEKDVTKPIDLLNSFEKWRYPPLDKIANSILSPDPKNSKFSYSYGPRLFNFSGQLNQLDDFVIPVLQKEWWSRKALVNFWDNMIDSSMNKKASPGMTNILFKIIDKKKLNVTAIIRSNDMFFGWPANVYHLYVIQKYVAKKLGLEIGEIITFSFSAHIFEDQFEFVEQVI
ncbi:thymidylate synthase [Candidatus Woesearchaeota archaeon]|nr:thymidylate synthase [Candidatus Woesearchaeota archaeon]